MEYTELLRPSTWPVFGLLSHMSPGWVAESRQAMGLAPMPGIWAADLAQYYVDLVYGDATGQIVEAEEAADPIA